MLKNKLVKKSERKNGTDFVEQFPGSLRCSIFILRKPGGRSVYFCRQMWAQITTDEESTGLADYVALMKMEWRSSGPWVADGVDDVEDASGEGGGEGLRDELSRGRPREHLDLACAIRDGRRRGLYAKQRGGERDLEVAEPPSLKGGGLAPKLFPSYSSPSQGKSGR